MATFVVYYEQYDRVTTQSYNAYSVHTDDRVLVLKNANSQTLAMFKEWIKVERAS